MPNIKKLVVPPREELVNRYDQPGSTISSIAREYNTSQPTVRKWMIDYNIPRKSHKQASTEANNRHRIGIKPPREELVAVYEDASVNDLESYYNVGQQTVYEWLRDYDIPLRTLSESTTKAKEKQYADIQFTYDFLDEHYDRTRSINELAKKLNVSRGHIFKQLTSNGIEIEPADPVYRSNAEIELFEYLRSQFPDDKWTNSNKTIINPYELDIVNHDKKIAVEYCGLFWHSEASRGRGRQYHRNKYLMCKEAGYKLITVFESDDMAKVRALLLKLFGKTEKIGARKTTARQIRSSVAGQFHEAHHLHSRVGARYHYGLFLDEELVMVASFGANRFGKAHQYECARITSHSDKTVVGGVSKLIKYFIREHDPDSIITFADLRFGDGSVYRHCNFMYIGDAAPNYWYSRRYVKPLYSRVKFQKHKLESQLEHFDPQKTEFENMVDNNWDRIWDCGNAKYEYKKGGAEAPPD